MRELKLTEMEAVSGGMDTIVIQAPPRGSSPGHDWQSPNSGLAWFWFNFYSDGMNGGHSNEASSGGSEASSTEVEDSNEENAIKELDSKTDEEREAIGNLADAAVTGAQEALDQDLKNEKITLEQHKVAMDFLKKVSLVGDLVEAGTLLQAVTDGDITIDDAADVFAFLTSTVVALAFPGPAGAAASILISAYGDEAFIIAAESSYAATETIYAAMQELAPVVQDAQALNPREHFQQTFTDSFRDETDR